jgi:hypothetical protein
MGRRKDRKNNLDINESEVEETLEDSLDRGPFVEIKANENGLMYNQKYVSVFSFIGIVLIAIGAFTKSTPVVLIGVGALVIYVFIFIYLAFIAEAIIKQRLNKSNSLQDYEGYIEKTETLALSSDNNMSSFVKFEYYLKVVQYPVVKTRSIDKLRYKDHSVVNIKIDPKKPKYCLIVPTYNTEDIKLYDDGESHESYNE